MTNNVRPLPRPNKPHIYFECHEREAHGMKEGAVVEGVSAVPPGWFAGSIPVIAFATIVMDGAVGVVPIGTEGYALCPDCHMVRTREEKEDAQ